jgi:hypothetical protein
MLGHSYFSHWMRPRFEKIIKSASFLILKVAKHFLGSGKMHDRREVIKENALFFLC